jgi:hypothetical protein
MARPAISGGDAVKEYRRARSLKHGECRIVMSRSTLASARPLPPGAPRPVKEVQHHASYRALRVILTNPTDPVGRLEGTCRLTHMPNAALADSGR